jgi:hypothetical protein
MNSKALPTIIMSLLLRLHHSIFQQFQSFLKHLLPLEHSNNKQENYLAAPQNN